MAGRVPNTRSQTRSLSSPSSTASTDDTTVMQRRSPRVPRQEQRLRERVLEDEVLFDSSDESSDLEVEFLPTDTEDEPTTANTGYSYSASSSNQVSPTAVRLSSLAQGMVARRLRLLNYFAPSQQAHANDSNNDIEIIDVVNERPRSDDHDGVIVVAESDPEDDEVQVLVPQSEQVPGPSHARTSNDRSSPPSRYATPELQMDVPNPVAHSNDPNENEDSTEEIGPPPAKMARLDTTTDDDGAACNICYENFTNSGSHRVCCLRCGHIFGKECIEKWIQSQKRCPQCNCKAMKKDIRIIYVKNLKVMDTTELERLKGELDEAKIERNKVEMSNAQYRVQVQLKTQEIERLTQEIFRLRSRAKEPPEFVDLEPLHPSSSRAAAIHDSSASQSAHSNIRMPKLQLAKHFEIREGQCRVSSYSEWSNTLVVSHAINSRLFPGGSFGIRKINCLDMQTVQSFPVHQKAIRDMSFSPSQNDLLLTAGLDKKATLFNCTSNCAVQTFHTTNQLWSCCWNTVRPDVFYVGGLGGKVVAYDIRRPQMMLSEITLPSTDKSAVAGLKYIPPSYQTQSFNMSGLMVQKLNSVWFCEMLGGESSNPRFHQLPLEGPFLHVDFEPTSRHILVSSRPKLTPRVGSGHLVCSLGKTYSEAEERDLFSCDVIQSITGGFQESSILCRSSIFSPEQGKVYVAANGEIAKTVRVWDVGNIEQKTLVRINVDAAIDFTPGKVNETNFLGILTDTSMDMYSVK